LLLSDAVHQRFYLQKRAVAIQHHCQPTYGQHLYLSSRPCPIEKSFGTANERSHQLLARHLNCWIPSSAGRSVFTGCWLLPSISHHHGLITDRYHSSSSNFFVIQNTSHISGFESAGHLQSALFGGQNQRDVAVLLLRVRLERHALLFVGSVAVHFGNDSCSGEAGLRWKGLMCRNGSSHSKEVTSSQ